MSVTKAHRHLKAPRSRVYAALIEATAVATWRVPDGMKSEVHEFEAREGGRFRISLSYDAPGAAGKTSAHTDTYYGRFERLLPDEQVVEVLAFETADPAMQGEMRVTWTLRDHPDGGTELAAVHEGVPPGVPPADNELGWEISLRKLAAFVQR